jgi:hypothetical protein
MWDLAGIALQSPMPASLQLQHRPRRPIIYLGRTPHPFPGLRATLSSPITPRRGPQLSPWNVLRVGDNSDATQPCSPESPTTFVQRHKLGLGLGAELGDNHLDRTLIQLEPSSEVAPPFWDFTHSIMEYNHRTNAMQPWYWSEFFLKCVIPDC